MLILFLLIFVIIIIISLIIKYYKKKILLPNKYDILIKQTNNDNIYKNLPTIDEIDKELSIKSKFDKKIIIQVPELNLNNFQSTNIPQLDNSDIDINIPIPEIQVPELNLNNFQSINIPENGITF